MTIEQKNMQVMSDLDACFAEVGLTPLKSKPEGVLCVASELTYENNRILVSSIYHQDMGLVESSIYFGIIPREKRLRVVQLINEINSHLMCEHFTLHTDNGLLLFRSGIYVPRYFLDKDHLKLALQQLLAKSYEFFPLIDQVLFYKKNPHSVMRRYLRKREKQMKEMQDHEKEEKTVPQDFH